MLKRWLYRLWIPFIVILGVMVASNTLVGCRTVSEQKWDPEFELRHDFSLTGANNVEYGKSPTSCVETPSDVENRGTICRVVDGYEGVGDARNWKIDVINTAQFPDPSAPPIQIDGGSSSNTNANTCRAPELWADVGSQLEVYGCGITFDDGSRYEGCAWNAYDDDWWCDYRIRKPVVLKLSTGGWDYVLRKFWAWKSYVASAVGCAAGLAAVERGNKVTYPFLVACADGPMPS